MTALLEVEDLRVAYGKIEAVKGISFSVNAGEVVIAGVAWAQHRGIDKVEVRIGDGDWQEAELADEPTIDSWRQWMLTWSAEPGEYAVSVRATDGTGQVQTDELASPAPDGASGWHTVDVTVEAA